MLKQLLCGMTLLTALGLSSRATAQEPTPVEAFPVASAPVVGVEAAPRSLIPSLAYNHYHPEVPSGLIPARLYLCPRYNVPAFVGHTYITYPPFAPHEYLWLHSRGYYRIHPDGTSTVTTIHWEHR